MIVERQYVNPMEMTFIGKDGSMGLRHGKTYRVLMFCAEGHIWVSWNDRDDCMKVCPYASLNTLYANWLNFYVYQTTDYILKADEE